mgnify:FL=1
MRYALKILLILTTIFNSGCVFLQTVGASASATGAYFSYKALQQDLVNVTTIGKECILGFKYTRVSCADRAVMSSELKDKIARDNRVLVELCGVERPEIIRCD